LFDKALEPSTPRVGVQIASGNLQGSELLQTGFAKKLRRARHSEVESLVTTSNILNNRNVVLLSLNLL